MMIQPRLAEEMIMFWLWGGLKVPHPLLEIPFPTTMEWSSLPSESKTKMYFDNFSLLFRDRDQDLNKRENCATKGWSGGGGWWYRSCAHAKPTGLQKPTRTPFGIIWADGGARSEGGRGVEDCTHQYRFNKRDKSNICYDSWAEALYELVPN